VLSLAGIQPPDYLQGTRLPRQVRGTHPQPFNHGFRGRMDERYDPRAPRFATGAMFILRQYMPAQDLRPTTSAYMFETPTTRVWKKLYDEGKPATGAEALLGDEAAGGVIRPSKSDPDEVNNLAGSPQVPGRSATNCGRRNRSR